MKSKRTLFYLALACVELVSISSPAAAQTFPNVAANYYWQVGDGSLDTPGNYNNKDATATAAVSSARLLFFGYPGTPTSATVSLNSSDATSLGKSYDVMTGNFTFDLNGNTNVATVLGTKAWTFGDGSGTTPNGGNGPTVHFIDSSENANTVNFASITLGANDSSNNVWGGSNATITFGSNVTANLTGAAITVGSADGGSTGNVFNGTSGQTYGTITVNAGAGNGAVLNNSTITGGIIYNGGTLTLNNGVTVNTTGQALVLGAGLNLNLSTGSSITTTGVGITNTSTTQSVSTGVGSKLTVDGGSITTPNVAFAGDVTIQNGGNISTQGAIVNGSNVNSVSDTLAGTLSVTGAGSAFNGGVLVPAKNILGRTNLLLETGAQISVTDGGSFLENSNLLLDTSNGASGPINLNVDSQSTFNVLGTIEADSSAPLAGLNITGGGTVNVGNFAVGVGAGGQANVNVGTGTLSVGTLTLAASEVSLEVQGRLVVTNSLVIGNKAAMASGDQLEFNGNVALSGAGSSQALTVNTRAMLNGEGQIISAATNGGEILLKGGTIRVGDDSAITGQVLSFNNALNVQAPSTFEFSLYDDGSNDQLQLGGSGGAIGSFTLKLNLVGDLGTLKSEFDAGQTTFDLFGDLNGNTQGTGVGTVTLDSSTIAALAAEGYSVDTSMLATNGTITLDALSVPEPSTCAFLLCGLAGLLWWQRARRTQSV